VPERAQAAPTSYLELGAGSEEDDGQREEKLEKLEERIDVLWYENEKSMQKVTTRAQLKGEMGVSLEMKYTKLIREREEEHAEKQRELDAKFANEKEKEELEKEKEELEKEKGELEKEKKETLDFNADILEHWIQDERAAEPGQLSADAETLWSMHRSRRKKDFLDRANKVLKEAGDKKLDDIRSEIRIEQYQAKTEGVGQPKEEGGKLHEKWKKYVCGAPDCKEWETPRAPDCTIENPYTELLENDTKVQPWEFKELLDCLRKTFKAEFGDEQEVGSSDDQQEAEIGSDVLSALAFKTRLEEV
jgi:hypothetical protein